MAVADDPAEVAVPFRVPGQQQDLGPLRLARGAARPVRRDRNAGCPAAAARRLPLPGVRLGQLDPEQRLDPRLAALEVMQDQAAHAVGVGERHGRQPQAPGSLHDFPDAGNAGVEGEHRVAMKGSVGHLIQVDGKRGDRPVTVD